MNRPLPFGPVRNPQGKVFSLWANPRLREDRAGQASPGALRSPPFGDHRISHRHLRLIVDRNPPPLEALRELQREFDEPRTSEGWWILAGAVSALAWLAFFFLLGWL